MDDDTGTAGPSSTATATPPPDDDPSAGGPRVASEEARDLTRLRRSDTDRKVLGVCGGVARQLDVDPTLVRVVVAILVLFGGAGLLLYLGGWLFVPDERTDRAVIHLEGGARSVALVVVGVLATLTALGQGWSGPFGGWWFFSPAPLLLLAVVGAVVWFAGRRRGDRPAVPAGQGYTPPPPGGTQRLVPAYTPPTRPARTGPVLFWPTLAVIAVGLGAMGLYDASGGTVPDGAYGALALAVTGVGLVVGAFRGRPGGLVLLALVCAAATALGVVAGTVPQAGQASVSPDTAAQVRPAYRIGNGDLLLDLTEVRDPQALDGRRIELGARSGIVRVVLPDGVGARVDARVALAGAIDVDGAADQGGFSPHLTTTLGAPAGTPVVDLDIDSRLGAISVRNQ